MSDFDSTDSMLDAADYQIETLRQYRTARIDEHGEDEFTDAVLYIIELLEAVRDIESLVHEVADDRIAQDTVETQDIRQTAEDARKTAEDAVTELKTLQNQFRVRKREVDTRISELTADTNDAIADLRNTLDGLSSDVDSLKQTAPTESTPDESVASLREDVERLSSDVEALDERVSSLSRIPDPDTLEQSVERVVEAEQNARAAKSTVTSLDAQIENRLDKIRDDVDRLDAMVNESQSPSAQSPSAQSPSAQSPSAQSLEVVGEVSFADERVARLESDLARLRDENEVSDLAWRLLRTHLIGLADTTESEQSRQTPSSVSAPKSGSNLHLGMVALASLRWLRSADSWATGGELHQHSEIPTGKLSRDEVSGVLSPLFKTHGVAERQETETANATWEYRLTDAGLVCLREIGPHPSVSETEFEKWVGQAGQRLSD
jgi:hypothetical protein